MDKRDPERLYEQIKQVQNNRGISITEAADLVEEEHKVQMNGHK